MQQKGYWHWDSEKDGPYYFEKVDGKWKFRGLSANAWQIFAIDYDTDKPRPGAKAAARGMNALVTSGIKKVNKLLGSGVGLQDAVTSVGCEISDAFEKWSELGACDTEPRGELTAIFRQWAKLVHGADLDLWF